MLLPMMLSRDLLRQRFRLICTRGKVATCSRILGNRIEKGKEKENGVDANKLIKQNDCVGDAPKAHQRRIGRLFS